MQEAVDIAKSLGLVHNVCLRVIDEPTGKVVREHVGHNSATNTLITGIGQFLLGGSTTGAGQLLDQWIPQYISLGTMGLGSQEEDADGLPARVGDTDIDDDAIRMTQYLERCPAYGSDGYGEPGTPSMNDRAYAGLGPMFPNRQPVQGQLPTIGCELISNTFPRSAIAMRQALSEGRSEYPRTIDVIFSTLISTGALAQFREPGKNYLFVSEVGLWSTPTWADSGSNGLLAGYRIAPPDRENWDMTVEANRQILKKQILKVGINQAVQVIWKIQLGSLDEFAGAF